jgi:GAF domain-containing protein
MLQGQKDLKAVGGLILSELAPVVAAQQAEFYVLDTGQRRPEPGAARQLRVGRPERARKRIDIGEGPVGQCAIEKQKILLSNVPENYLRVSSGLGVAAPRNILVLPIIFESQIKGVIELASFEGFRDTHQAFLEQLTDSLGIVINTIEANTRTVDLLTQSQSLAHELQSRQQELQTDQRGAAGEGATPRPPEPGSRNGRTRKSSRHGRRSRKRRASSRSPRSTSPSSWPTCRTRCARRSTAC